MVRWTIRSKYWQDEPPDSSHLPSIFTVAWYCGHHLSRTPITALLTDAHTLTFILLHLTWSHGYPIFQSIFPFWPFIHTLFIGVPLVLTSLLLLVLSTASIWWPQMGSLWSTRSHSWQCSGTYFRLYNVKFLTNICHELWQPHHNHHITPSWLTTPHRYNVCTPYNKQ